MKEYNKYDNPKLEALGLIGINGSKGELPEGYIMNPMSSGYCKTTKVGNYFKVHSNYTKRKIK